VLSNTRAGLEILTAAAMNIAISWDTAPCSPNVNRRLGETHPLHNQNAYPATACYLLARLIFDLENRDDNFLRNVGPHTDQTPLYP
jgi:hypothetical protein